ncbi:MAG TPA: hypothetical protein PKD68_04315 [Candidatus Saccharibacteria bacterium]|nr:hypothetical protein [Candidatus Saccharibacteria bacterium]
MGATTTVFKNLLKQLASDFPALRFQPGNEYRWSPDEKTVYFDQEQPKDTPLLLHETAHALLGHVSYDRDIELIQLEREAWTKAEELGRRYSIVIAENTREDALDSYRDWLHARSLCPSCAQNGVQIATNQYTCVLCNAQWHVNDAKHCGLRRQRLR